MMRDLTPSYYLSDLYPAGSFLAPRSTSELIRWVFKEPFRPDTATAHTVAIMGKMPLVCHRNAFTGLIRDFLAQAGIATPEGYDLYDDEHEARMLAEARLATGGKLAYVYPPPPQLHGHEGLLMPVSLYNWLNDKANLNYLVPAENLPRHVLLDPADYRLLSDVFPGEKVYVKACHAGASGAGSDVRYCPDAGSRTATIEWLDSRLQGLSAIRIEEEAEIGTCWCVNVSALDSGLIYLGSAAQVFSAPGKQTGNCIDPEDMPPDTVLTLAFSIAEHARSKGFRGVAGFDMGMRQNGQPVVFDLNFRLVACTPQILLHDAATARAGARISWSISKTIPSHLQPALEKLAPFCRDGLLIPIRMFEADSITGGNSFFWGFVVGETMPDVEALVASIDQTLEGVMNRRSDC